MAVALRRSAYSTNIKTRADFSCAFFDRDLNVVAQAFCQAVHLGSLVHLVPIAIRAYGPENLGPGDAILCNDPYLGGVHLNDISLISPVYYENELFGYVANMAHHVDVGGGRARPVSARFARSTKKASSFRRSSLSHPTRSLTTCSGSS